MEEKKRGVTLTELIIGMSLILMLLALFTLVFVYSQRRFLLINAVFDTQNNAIMGMDRFAADLAETNRSSVRRGDWTTTAESFIGFPTARDKDGRYQLDINSNPAFTEWIVYYLALDARASASDGERRFFLLKRRFTPPPTAPPTVDEVRNHTTAMTGANIIARRVYAFSVDETGNTYKTSLETRQLFRGKTVNFKLERNIYVEEVPSGPPPSPTPGPEPLPSDTPPLPQD